LITHIVYTYLVTEYGNPLFLETVVWSLIVQVIFTALIAFLTQAFFLWRIYRLTHNNLIVSAAVALVILADLVASLIYFSKGLDKTTFAELGTLSKLSEAIDGLTVAADVAIAAGLIYALQTAKTGFERSNGVLNRLIVFAISTGFLTSLDAILALIFAVSLPSTFIYMAFYAPLAKLYVNSLLSNLNARKALRSATDTQLSSIPMQRYGQNSVLTRGDNKDYDQTKSKIGGSRHPSDPLNIQISTTTMLAYDRSDTRSADRITEEMKAPGLYGDDEVSV